MEQALADYAELIYSFKSNNSAFDSPVIGFGGSYGGMLTSWMREKYPNVLAGGIAASAPIFANFGEGNPFLETDGGASYWRVITNTAGVNGGNSPKCPPTVRDSFAKIEELGKTECGRSQLNTDLKLCTPLKDESKVDNLKLYLAFAWDYMSMGDFPYESSYLTGDPNVLLPPFPIRLMCETMLNDTNLITAMGSAANVYYNASKTETCLDVPDYNGGAQIDGVWMW